MPLSRRAAARATWASWVACVDVGFALDRLIRDLEAEHGRLAIDIARCRERRQFLLAADLTAIQNRMTDLLKAGRTWRKRVLPR